MLENKLFKHKNFENWSTMRNFSKIHENSSFQLKSVTKIEAVHLRDDRFGHFLGPFDLSCCALSDFNGFGHDKPRIFS